MPASRRSRWLVSLRNRLVASVFAITAIAFAILFAVVSTGLENRLERESLASLSSAASRFAPAIGRQIGGSASQSSVEASLRRAALASGDRVTLLIASQTPAGAALAGIEADSGSPDVSQRLSFGPALSAVRTGQLVTGTEATPGGRVGEAAFPISYPGSPGTVLVLSSSLGDIPGAVASVQREVLIGGAIALAIALALALAVARPLSARVKRLERAAGRLAAGDFGQPIPVDSSDELGQLARAFNDMQRQLAQLETARKQFIATASHELRTPIFSLGGFVELLEEEELDAETRRRFLGQVRDQVERLRKLSVDLLDLSKLEAGSLELRPEPVDIGELTRSVSGEFEPALAQHDSHLELRFTARTIEALCDPVRVAQIMRILIDNALTHTSSGTRIVVTAGREDGFVRVSVRDDGEGVPPDAQTRIFEPFYTADDAQGSGLGLAIASELAERMSGRLVLESAPGGTTFTLEIPADA